MCVCVYFALRIRAIVCLKFWGEATVLMGLLQLLVLLLLLQPDVDLTIILRYCTTYRGPLYALPGVVLRSVCAPVCVCVCVHEIYVVCALHASFVVTECRNCKYTPACRCSFIGKPKRLPGA